MRGVDVVWVVRDDYMASHFIDAGAAEFLADAVRGAVIGRAVHQEKRDR